MWISKATASRLEDLRQDLGSVLGTSVRLEVENARLRADLDWFKHRLNQVEMERAMLMQDRIGVKINVPQFVPAMDNPADTLNEMPDLSTVGGDAPDHEESEADKGNGVDFSMMPGYKAKR